MITQAQAHAIAKAIATIREDWDPQGILHALRKVADRDPATVLAAAARAAADPTNRTPAAIAQPGPHWHTGIPTADRHPSATPAAELCTEHGTARSRCGCARRPPTNPAERVDRNRRWAAHIRTQLGWQQNHDDTNNREEVTQ